MHPAVLEEIRQFNQVHSTSSSWYPESPLISSVVRNLSSPLEKVCNPEELFKSAFDELIDTEKSFGRKLDLLNLLFSESLSAFHYVTGEEPILSEEQIYYMFMNIKSLQELSKDLVDDLTGIRKEKEAIPELILGIFHLTEERLLSEFGTYCLGFNYAQKLCLHLLSTDSKFAVFVRRTERVAKSRLTALMSEPIQRLMRYSMLLKKMQEYSDEMGRKVLGDAIDVVEKVSVKINASLIESSSLHMTHVLEQRLFRGKVCLVSGSRKCLRFSYLLAKNVSKSSRGSPSREYFFVLFSDMLVYAQMSKDKRSGTIKHCIPLACMVVDRKIPSHIFATKHEHSFVLRSTYKTLLLSSCSEECTNGWIENIRNAVKKHCAFSSDGFSMGSELDEQVLQTSNRLEGRPILESECPWINL